MALFLISGCEDIYERSVCESWAGADRQGCGQSFMLENCRKTCELCATTPAPIATQRPSTGTLFYAIKITLYCIFWFDP